MAEKLEYTEVLLSSGRVVMVGGTEVDLHDDQLHIYPTDSHKPVVVFNWANVEGYHLKEIELPDAEDDVAKLAEVVGLQPVEDYHGKASGGYL